MYAGKPAESYVVPGNLKISQNVREDERWGKGGELAVLWLYIHVCVLLILVLRVVCVCVCVCSSPRFYSHSFTSHVVPSARMGDWAAH